MYCVVILLSKLRVISAKGKQSLPCAYTSHAQDSEGMRLEGVPYLTSRALLVSRVRMLFLVLIIYVVFETTEHTFRLWVISTRKIQLRNLSTANLHVGMFSFYTNLDSLQAFDEKQDIEKRDANFFR